MKSIVSEKFSTPELQDYRHQEAKATNIFPLLCPIPLAKNSSPFLIASLRCAFKDM